MKIVLATQNQKKRAELAGLVGARATVVTLADVGLQDLEIDERATTFEGNARLKAEGVWAALQARGAAGDTAAVLADDSGLMVDALAGLPGVRSARFAADHGTAFLGPTVDAANNALLLLLLGTVPDERRTARFHSHVCARRADGSFLDATGDVEGRIARDLVGQGGFGYDPLFVLLEGGDDVRGRRMAELTAEQKDAVSHRGKAMRALLPRLFA